MKPLRAIVAVLFVLAGCSEEKIESASAPPTATQPQATTQTSSDLPEPVNGVWAGQIRIDAHEGTAVLNYVGRESGDFVPMRFRASSEVGTKILAQCADEDLCEVEGSVRFLDEPPPENASAVGEILTVTRVKKLPADAL